MSCSPEVDRPGGGQGAGKIRGYGEELGNGQIGPSPAVAAFELPPYPALVPEVAPLPGPEQVESRTGQVTAPMAQPTRALKSSAPAATEEGTEEVTREEQVALAVDMHGDGATQQEIAKAGGFSRATVGRWLKAHAAEATQGKHLRAING
ncbi:helix-turn-helix domain-containing protein [Flaviflexus ciconiae]|uniref:Helix-turn-helix domain-containing protein n=1 Tax=Flaviflexus ciconiae TaxID=2496867 RepID=A0A3S9PVE0_9ACTO|nr:helix-turn-helix domain-containing protein [Flaviflexus ciconiae]AZQ76298.1 helix-turn-helix domain-containing protein [Flaviflexus ciconiae]